MTQSRCVALCLVLSLVCLLLIVPPSWSVEQDYVVGVDDVLHIIVWDHKDLEQEVVVRPDGKISFPLAGEFRAAGLTAAQLTEALTAALLKAVKNPVVSVMVKEIRSFRVYFVGRVAKPGVYPIKAGTPFLQALTLAGGPGDGADLPAAYIIRRNQKIAVDLRRLIQEGDLSKNLVLETEDTIVIPELVTGRNPQETVESRIYVLGKVEKPGIYALKNEVPILHALFLAGGLADGGALASAFVVRNGTKIPVDLWRLVQKGDLSQNVMIKNEDTIVVPSGGELQNSVFVMGEVNRPGMYSQPDALTILKVVSLAGGLTPYAAASRITLIRQNGASKTLTKLNLSDIMNDPAKHGDPPLEPGDVVVVPQRLF